MSYLFGAFLSGGGGWGETQVACMDDTWWSPAALDSTYGACHTFNPCHGFPVGQARRRRRRRIAIAIIMIMI